VSGACSGQDDHDADVARGGPNWALSLTLARVNYLQFGACEKSMIGNVRPPRPSELSEQLPTGPPTAPDRGGM